MKRLIVWSMGLAFAGTTWAAGVVDSVAVRQDWPWSANVVVAVTVSGADAAGVDLAVHAYNGETDLGAIPMSALASGTLYGATNGVNLLAFNPDKVFASASVGAFRQFRVDVSVAGPADPYLDREEYRIYDLVDGTVTSLTRRDFYEHPETWGAYTTNYATIGPDFSSPLANPFIWTGVNSNDAYRTTKLVMKRIPAADVTWWMGPTDDDTEAKRADATYTESRFQVKFTYDYYMGVFELTQKQHELITGYNPSFFQDGTTYNDNHPLENISGVVVLSPTGFCAKATAKFADGKTFSLPTEAEWEYAAKAGYDGTLFPNGKARTMANLGELEGRSASSGSTNPKSHSVHTQVGAGRPNAFGLFNTLGNVREQMRESVRTNLLSYYTNVRKWTQPFVDPVNVHGSDVGGDARVFKGADFNQLGGTTPSPYTRPSYREGNVPGRTSNSAGCPGVYGYRVMCK